MSLNRTYINEIPSENNGIFLRIAVPVFNSFPRKRNWLKDFLPKSFVMMLVVIIMTSAKVTAAVVITVTGSPVAGMTTTYGTASVANSFTVKGTGLAANLVVAAPPAGFEISMTSATTGFVTTAITLVPAGGTVNTTTIWIRLTATAKATGSPYSGTIAVSSGATNKTVTINASTVNKIALTINIGTLAVTTKTYDGTTTATLTGSAGTLNGVLPADLLNVTLGGSPTAVFTTASAGAGKAVTLSGYTLSGSAAGNYTAPSSTLPALTGTINTAPLTVTATGPAKTYGTALTTGTSTTNFTYSGTVNGETVTGVTLTPDAAGQSTSTAIGATYVVTPSFPTGGGGFLASNYNITNVAFSGTVTNAILTITCVSQSQVYGSVSTSLTFTTSGWVNGDTQASMTTTPNETTTAVSTSGVGAYPITASGAVVPAYYTITYVSGTFTITGAPLTITATGPAKTQGVAVPSGPSTTNFTFYGAINNETVTSVTLTPDANGLSTTVASGTTYVVTPSAPTGINGFLASNYIITYKVYSGICGNTYTWTGNTSTTWSTNTNWSSNVTPGANDNVIIPAATVNAPTVTASTTINTLTFTGTNDVTVNTGTNVATTITLTVNKSLAVPSGVHATFSMAGTFSQLTIGTNTSAANFNNNGTFSMSGGALLVNAGTNYIYNSSTGTITLNGGNTFDITGNGSSGNTAIFNEGTFFVGTSNSLCELTFDDSQSIANGSTGNFYIGSTSLLRYFNTSAHNCTVSNTSGGNFTLQSDAYGTGSIEAIPGTTNSFTGPFTVERYVTGLRGYRLLASPVYSGTSGSNNVYSLNYVQNSAYVLGSGGTAGGFDNTGNPNLYIYREDVPVSNSSFISGNWQGVNNLNSGNNTIPTYTFDYTNTSGAYSIPVSNGFLFFFRGNRYDLSGNPIPITTETNPGYLATTATLSTTGYLNYGQVVFRDWYTPGSTSLGYSNPGTVKGFNCVANPYPCTIDWETLQSTSTTTGIYYQNVSPFVYELDPVNQNFGTYKKGSLVLGTNNAYRYIVSGQAFFVLATGAAQLILNETAKGTQAANGYDLLTNVENTGTSLLMGKPADQVANIRYLRLQMAMDSIHTDETLIMFADNARNDFNPMVDAPYKQGSGRVSLSSIASNRIPLAISTLPLTVAGQKIGLNVGANADGTYSLNMTEIKEIPLLYDILLIDAYTRDTLDMRRKNTYSFSILHSDTNSFGSNRFSLVLRQDAAYAYRLVDFTANKVPNARQAEVVWKTKNEQNYTYFTVERSTDKGKTFDVIGSVTSADLGTYSLLDKAPVTGVNMYRLKQVDYNNTTTYSNTASVEFRELNNDLTNVNLNVYPNPVSSTINLVITDPDVNNATTYKIMITNSVGSMVKQATTDQSNWQANVTDWLPGTYLVKVFDNKNQLVGNSKFVKL